MCPTFFQYTFITAAKVALNITISLESGVMEAECLIRTSNRVAL